MGHEYKNIKNRANQSLDKYREYPDIISFDDGDRSVTFFTERVIPSTSTNRPRVILLFSNPHPHSVHQGMFLSPNTKGRENPFWPVMADAGWLSIPVKNPTPKDLADICLKVKYQGPFELVFYCYYAFPTDFPEDIRKIFGKQLFSQLIESKAIWEFKKTIRKESIEAVVTFNKGIFNLVSNTTVERYLDQLIKENLVCGRIAGIDRYIPVFLTYPTGWRYHKEYRKLRKNSLEAIRAAIINRADMSK